MSYLRRIAYLLGLVGLASFFTVAAPAYAATVIYVDATSTASSPGGTSWGDAYTSLQDGLAAASAGDEIWVAQGVYYPDEGTGQNPDDPFSAFFLREGVGIYGGFDGTETTLDQRDPAAHVTVLSGDIDKNDTNKNADGVVTDPAGISGTNAYHVTFATSAITTATVLDGFTITAGLAYGGGTENGGGGMFINAGAPTLTNLVFSGNDAASAGGGLFNAAGAPILTGVVFSNNVASNFLGSGGGMYSASGSITLNTVTFSDNAAGSSGGGLFTDLTSGSLTNVTFSNNSAGSDGGGFVDSGGGTLTLTDVTFVDNMASSNGGGLFTEGDPTLTNVAFYGNSATGSGGGMYVDGGNPTLTNAVFSGNTADDKGGAVVNDGSTSTFINTTFYGNSADRAGGVYHFNSSAATIHNSIFWSNSAATAYPEMLNEGSSTTVTHTLIDENGVSSLIGGSWTKTGNSNIFDGSSPVFDDPNGLDNVTGTLDDNLRPSVNSPVIDTGNNAEIPSGVTTDIAGAPRPFDGDNNGTNITDMGAYEYYVGVYYVDADATGAATGLSWADAFPTLQEGLMAASGGSEIWVAEGVYYPDKWLGNNTDDPLARFTLYPNLAIYGGFNGTETALNQRDPATYHTVLSGDIDQNDTVDANGITVEASDINGDNSYSIVRAIADDGARLDGLTITGGVFDSDTFTYTQGSGLFSSDSDITLVDVTFIGHGALNGSVYLTNSANVTLTNVRVENGFSGSIGSGLFISNSTVALSNATFLNNAGFNGGAGMRILNGSDVTLTNAQFDGNRALDQEGGALYIQDSTLTATNTLFTNNSTEPFGGAIVQENSDVTLTNATITGNSTTNEGGALYISTASDTTTIENSIFWNNSAGLNGNAISGNTTNLSITHSLITSADINGAFTNNGGNITDGSNPLFVNAAGDDLRLQAASPAINAGDVTLLPADTADLDGDNDVSEWVSRDLNGSQRIDGGQVDMGAYEADSDIFVDVPSPNQPPFFEDWIEFFYQANITTGCNRGTPGVDLDYCPEDPVSRGAMAVFILRALNYPNLPHSPTGDPAQIFADVPSPNQPASFELWIEDFYTLGITTGCERSPLKYCPEDPVTRGAMAVFILRALNVAPVDDTSNPFVDVPSPNQPPTFEAYIETFYNLGITTGCTNGTEGVDLKFCPEDPVTRGAMALFILRAFDDIPNPEDGP